VAIAADGTVHLTLLISESGAVDRVIVEDADVPEVYQQSAQAAFAQASFTPGRLNGAATKSKVKIEVRYDSGLNPTLR
jgi:TonB family protein